MHGLAGVHERVARVQFGGDGLPVIAAVREVGPAVASRDHPGGADFLGHLAQGDDGAQRHVGTGRPVRGRGAGPVVAVAMQPLCALARPDDHHLAGVHPVRAARRQQHRIRDGAEDGVVEHVEVRRRHLAQGRETNGVRPGEGTLPGSPKPWVAVPGGEVSAALATAERISEMTESGNMFWTTRAPSASSASSTALSGAVAGRRCSVMCGSRFSSAVRHGTTGRRGLPCRWTGLGKEDRRKRNADPPPGARIR